MSNDYPMFVFNKSLHVIALAALTFISLISSVQVSANNSISGHHSDSLQAEASNSDEAEALKHYLSSRTKEHSINEIWLYRSFLRPNQTDKTCYLYVGVQDSIQIYFYSNQGRVLQKLNGKWPEPRTRDFPLIDFFEIPIQNISDSIRILFRFKNQFPVPRKMTTSILLLSHKEFQNQMYAKRHQEGQSLFLIGVFQGLTLAFIIFPFALFWLDKKPYYLLYIAYIFFVTLDDQVESERFTYLSFWFSKRPMSFVHFLNLFQGLAIITYVAFFRQFLNLKDKKPWLDKLLLWLIGYSALVFLLDFGVSLLGWFKYQNHLFFWLTRIPPALAAILSSIVSLRLRTLDSTFIGLGVISWMLGASAAFLSGAGLIPPFQIMNTIFTPYFFIHLGVLVELSFFSFAMGFRNQQHIIHRQTAEMNLQLKELLHRNNLEQISMDLHDEVGSLLSSISVLGEATLRNLPAGMSKERLAIISKRAREVMSLLSDIVWSVNPNNNHIDRIELHMREYAVELLEVKEIKLSFEIDRVLEQETLPMELRKDFYLLYKEAINNIAKYSAASKVYIKLYKYEQDIYLEIKDNGRGFDVEKVKYGNGIQNMQARAARLRGNFVLNSSLGNGVAISLSFPIT